MATATDETPESFVLKAKLESDLSRILQWGSAAESRLSWLVSLATAMLGALVISNPKGIGPSEMDFCSPTVIVAMLAGILLVASLAFSALASFPRTSGPSGSRIYYGGIADLDLEQYSAACRNETDTSYIEDLLQQCHRNSKIVQTKFRWIKASVAFLFVASPAWTAALFLFYSRGAS